MTTFEISFKSKNRTKLVKSAVLTFAALCFGVFYHPSSSSSSSHSNNDHIHPIENGKPIPERLRNLGSSNQHYKDEANYEKKPFRAGACANVDYANTTYLEEVDMSSLTLNELLIKLDHPHYVSPPNPHGPTIVDIGLYVHNIFDLDPGRSTFKMEGYLDLIWCDPHTKFDATAENKDKHVYLERDAAKELEAIWWPAIAFVNEKGKRDTENQEVIIESDGTVEYREKFKVTLSTRYDMTRFPFDRQVLRAEVESFAWNAEYLQFHVEEDLVGFSDDFEIPEQTMTHIEEHLETVKEARDRFPFSELVTEIYVYRNPSFYVTKVCIPLTLIVAITWAVFWMHPTDLADRMAISFTGVLSSVAYQFVVTDVIPRHVTNTFLANFVLLTFIMQILIAVENVLVRTMHHGGHPMMAKMVDRICRIMVPLFFIAICNIIASAQVLKDDTLAIEGVLGLSIGLPVLLIIITCFMVRRYTMKHPECKIKGQGSSRHSFARKESATTSQHVDIESGDSKTSQEETMGGRQEYPLFNAELESDQPTSA